MIVALDGPAGSGKSTTARRVAERLGWLYLDTGAMYRAVGLAFRDRGLPFTAAAARTLLPALDVRLRPAPDRTRVALDGVDVTDRIRTAQAAEDASRVSRLAPVREAMVALQRTVARETDAGGVVAEGRDVGTVVFPDADVKFFLVADLDARARRRLADFAASAPDPSGTGEGGAGSSEDPAAFEKVRAEIAERDRRDESRALAPLRPAPDARRLDTTALSVEDQVDEVLRAVRAR